MTEQGYTPTILCLSSFFKGNKFLETCKKEGWRVILLVREAILGENWAREFCDEVFALPSLFDRSAIIRTVSYLARTREIDRISPLDDFDVEMAASLREHLRIPGMGESTARYFRDKLAMRARARDRGIAVPEFVHALNDERIGRFLREVPPPWLLKPRSEANSFGITKFSEPGPLWQRIQELGDDRSLWLIERYLPGDVCHVDAVVHEGQAVLAEAHRYRRPLMDVAKGGGVFATRTLERDSEEARELCDHHQAVVRHFGLRYGVTHMEFIRSEADGGLYFLETAARVGGAHIYDLVEASSGVNLWAEWAKLELAQGERPYVLPERRTDYGGLVIALAREEQPDTSQFNDPEIVKRLEVRNHVGLVLRSTSPERIEELLDAYETRIATAHLATLPEAPPRR
jgi:biotin carboxylase